MVDKMRNIPASLVLKDADAIRARVQTTRVISTPNWRTNFTNLGTFRLLDRDLTEREAFDLGIIPDEYWLRDLLDYDPYRFHLRTGDRGDILICQDGEIVKSISPQDIREVDGNSVVEMGTVGESGYLLPIPQHGAVFIDHQSFSPLEIEEILLGVEDGKRPPCFDWSISYAKVSDHSLVGKNLALLVFQSSGKGWERDGVVIDPIRRLVVGADIYKPFAPQRWILLV